MAGRPFKLPVETGNDERGQERSPIVLEEVGWQDGLLSYLGRREMMVEDRNGLSKGLEEAGRQDDLLNNIGYG